MFYNELNSKWWKKKLFISFDRVFVSNQNFIILQVKNCLNFKFFLK